MEQARTRSTNQAGVEFNQIEDEVIRVQRNVTKSGQCADEEEFRRDMFQSKKAHRVACLLAAARLIASFANGPCEDPSRCFADTEPPETSFNCDRFEDISG
eukprot:1567542-Rhodomonas_salina.1